jgi:hypothetical protein
MPIYFILVLAVSRNEALKMGPNRKNSKKKTLHMGLKIKKVKFGCHTLLNPFYPFYLGNHEYLQITKYQSLGEYIQVLG